MEKESVCELFSYRLTTDHSLMLSLQNTSLLLDEASIVLIATSLGEITPSTPAEPPLGATLYVNMLVCTACGHMQCTLTPSSWW